MAVNKNAYSPKQFSFLIAEQDDWGTVNPNSSGSPDNAYVALDVDSVGSPSLGVTQVLDPRSGSRVLQATDFFQDIKGSVKELTASGTATTEGLDILLANISGEGLGSASGVYSIASNVVPATFDATTTNQVAEQLLSIVIRSGLDGGDLAFKDCFCTNLVLSGDAGTEGGRIKFSATFKTGSAVASLGASNHTIDTAITANDYFMSAWDADDRIIAGVANNLLFSFSLNVTNDVVFAGLISTALEQAFRVGEISATADFTTKYDDTTDALWATYNGQTAGASTGATLMNHQASLATASFGFKMPSSVLTNVAFSEGDVMSLDCSVKALGVGIASSTAFVEIAC